jgi:hypothetical protein
MTDKTKDGYRPPPAQSLSPRVYFAGIFLHHELLHNPDLDTDNLALEGAAWRAYEAADVMMDKRPKPRWAAVTEWRTVTKKILCPGCKGASALSRERMETVSDVTKIEVRDRFAIMFMEAKLRDDPDIVCDRGQMDVALYAAYEEAEAMMEMRESCRQLRCGELDPS